MELGAANPSRRERGARRPAHPRPVSNAMRARRIATVAALIALVPAIYSYVGALTQTSNSSTGIRTVEWLRNNGAAGIVARVESVYYSLTAPNKGGPTLHALPKVGYGTDTPPRQGKTREYAPARVPALITPALPGEGVWHATRSGLKTNPPILLSTIRDQPEYPRVLAGLAWIDPKRTIVSLHPGRLEPSVELPRGAMDVPQSARHKLLATFNSGFKLADSKGGFAVGGHTYAPLRDGQGTFVGYSNGSLDVVDWTHGSDVPPGVSFARQNLPLIVSDSELNPNLSNGAAWGATVGNAVLVWRSGIGVDRHGDLIYAAGEDQSVRSLAKALLRAGAVRAMELDINSYWVSFITYGAPGALEPKNLLPGMERSDQRYLEPDDRDFLTVYSR